MNYPDSQPSTPVGVLHLFETSKEGIQKFAIQVINQIKSGEVNALRVKVYLKTMEQIIKLIDDNTRQEQLKESEKYAESKFNMFGCEIEKSEVGTKYLYESSSDPIHQRLSYEVEQATKRLKEREEFLKVVKEPMTIVDDMTGEVVTINPPVKKSTSGLKFSIK